MLMDVPGCKITTFWYQKGYKSVPTVRRLKICTGKCISNSLIHNFQGKCARFFFVFSIQNYDNSDMILV